MKTNLKFLGALFVAVVGGCAATRSTAVPLTPVAQGVPVDASSYDLTVDGAPGGRVLLKEGKAIRDKNGNELINVAIEIDNRTSDRTFRMPCDQIWLSNVEGQSAKLIQVDHQLAPSAIEVPAGDTHAFEMTFTPSKQIPLRKIRRAEVHWTLLIDGASEPVARTTSFVAVQAGGELAVEGSYRAMADRRDWDPPASYTDQKWNVVNARQMGGDPTMGQSTSARTTGKQRLWTEMPTGQP
jgi:hypothetical protein